MDISGDGRSCNQLKGKFVVRQIDYNDDGGIKDMAVDFVQHCESGASALHGALRYHSNVSITFG